MLDSTIQAQLKAYLERLQTPIELLASLDDSAAAAEMRELLGEIVALSDKVSVRHDGADARRPSFQITRAGADMGVRFKTFHPSRHGDTKHELLHDATLRHHRDVAPHRQQVPEAVRGRIASLPQRRHQPLHGRALGPRQILSSP